MKFKFQLILIFLICTFNSCQKEEEYWKTSPELKLFVLREIFWKQGSCPSPNIILEKGVTYNVTLKAGERFWFDFKDRRDSNDVKFKRYTLIVTKESGNDFGVKFSTDCSPNLIEQMSFSNGELISATEVAFKHTTFGNNPQGYHVEGISSFSNIIVSHTVTEKLE